jgi:hypothetical protein
MSDRICPCGKSFSIPALLKRHQNSKLGCIPYMMSLVSPKHEMHIEHKEEERERAKVVKEFFCKYCNRKLASKFSMERHQTTCTYNEDNKIKRDIAEITNNIINSSNIKYLLENIVNNIGNNNGELDIKMGELSIKYSSNSKFIDNQSIPSNQIFNSLLPIQNKAILNRNINIPELEFDEATNTITIPQTNIQRNVGNTSNTSTLTNNTYSPIVNGAITNANNSTNPTINNITNNITNNNGISDNVPYVYPFGYENISFLTENEVLDILKSQDGANLVLEKIYSHIDNNNFMKLNKKDKHMVYINSPNNIAYCNDKEFILKLYEQSKILLQRVFFQYFNRLSNKYKYIVWCNIQKINETLDNKSLSIADRYTNLIAKKINDFESKKQFNIIKKGVETNDANIISKNTNVYDISSLNIVKLNEELSNKTVNMDEINNIWNELHSNDNASYEEFGNDLTLHRFEDTPRYKLIQTLIKKELEFIKNTKSTMCDISNIYKNIQLRISNELNLIRQKFTDIDEEYITEIKNLLIIKPREDNETALLSLRFSNNNKDIVKIK